MTIKCDLIALLGTLPSVTCNFFSLILCSFLKSSLNPLNSLNSFVDKYFSVFISAYREAYSANDVLIRFIENRKQLLDNHKYVGIAKPIVY